MASGLTAYDLPTAPVVPVTSGPPPSGESYWDLVLRQYRRNTLAVIAFVFILMLFLIAILAPFLADNKPIVMRGSYPGLYRDTFEEWRLGGHPEFVAQITGMMDTISPEQSEEAASRLRTVERQLNALAQQLPPEQAARLREHIERYRNAAATGASAATSLQSVYDDIMQAFAPDKVTMESKLHWPVFSALLARDVFFLAVALVLIALLAFHRLLPASITKSMKVHAAIAVIPAAVLALLWSGRPVVFDTLDYKQQLFDGNIQASMALFPPIPYGTNEDHLENKFQGPSRTHLIGTDGNGRDLMTRMVWGSRISLSVGFVAVAIYVAIGIFVGTLAGYFRGWVDIALSRVIEIVVCFPAFFLILAVLAFLQPSMWNIMVVIGLTGWTTEARLVRGEFLRLADQEFVLAAKGLGVSDWRIIFRHVLPNGLAPLLVSASFGIASAILIESSLSFLGFGISIPVPSWGGILNEARESFRYWWITIFPGLAIFSTVTAYNLIGEGIRDAIDPRLKL